MIVGAFLKGKAFFDAALLSEFPGTQHDQLRCFLASVLSSC